jgi:hypothetical protein
MTRMITIHLCLIRSLQQGRHGMEMILTRELGRMVFVVAAIITAVAMLGTVIWATHGDNRTAARPQPQVTGTFGQSVGPEVPTD